MCLCDSDGLRDVIEAVAEREERVRGECESLHERDSVVLFVSYFLFPFFPCVIHFVSTRTLSTVILTFTYYF